VAVCGSSLFLVIVQKVLFLRCSHLGGAGGHLENIQGTFREHSGNIQGTFREQQATFRENSGHKQGTCTFRPKILDTYKP
jgi:hypothetical protein